jgi:flagellar motility protein MotE (MotC chaperone)
MRRKNMAEKKGKKKKSSLKTIFTFFIVGLIIAVSLLSIGYIVFEFNRISYYNLDLRNDWRSYLAFLTKDIPYLNDFIEYEYLEIGNPLENQKSLLEARLDSLDNMKDEIEKNKAELDDIQSQIVESSEELIAKQQELEKLEAEYQEKITEYNDYQNRIEKLASWLNSSTPQQIANALIRDEVSVELIVDAFYVMESKTVAEILQALANLNPEKAAKIIATLGNRGG